MNSTLQGATVDKFCNLNAFRSSAKITSLQGRVLLKLPNFTYSRLLLCPLFTYNISDQMEQILQPHIFTTKWFLAKLQKYIWIQNYMRSAKLGRGARAHFQTSVFKVII
jgi:hypothetical protein